MRHALRMSSSFVYQPHVVQSDETLITPDIAIDRGYTTMTADGLEPEPVARLTSASVIQEPDGTPLGAPALVFVAAVMAISCCGHGPYRADRGQGSCRRRSRR